MACTLLLFAIYIVTGSLENLFAVYSFAIGTEWRVDKLEEEIDDG
jgi:hypothetical protein